MINNIVFDLDGIFTDGSFYYSNEGKVLKKFGPNDSDGIKLLKSLKVQIHVITADHRGYKISEARMIDMGLNLKLVNENERYDYIQKNFEFDKLVYMGDGIYDAKILNTVKFGIATSNSTIFAKKSADYVTKNNGGGGAVFEASIIICQKFFIKEFNNFLSQIGIDEKDL